LQFPCIENVQVQNIPTSIQFINTSKFVIHGCVLINWSVAGVNIQNTNNSDSGDSCISDCFINTGVTAGYGIYHQSSGGLKVVNNKLLGGSSGYVLAWVGSTSADILLSNNSIEDTTNFGIYFSRASGTGSVGSVCVTGNEINCPNGIETDTSGVLTLLNITGNVINVQSTSGQCIVLNNVSNFIIGPNVHNGQGGGSPVGISTTSTCSNGKIQPQTFVNIPAASRISNGSTTVLIDYDSQSGTTGNITSSTAYGSFFIGSLAITFPVAFSVTPQVFCSPVSTGAGSISAWATGITTTGCTINMLALTTGEITTAAWKAFGII
jgi:hypothetical protein